jgi:hypothetical protein
MATTRIAIPIRDDPLKEIRDLTDVAQARK